MLDESYDQMREVETLLRGQYDLKSLGDAYHRKLLNLISEDRYILHKLGEPRVATRRREEDMYMLRKSGYPATLSSRASSSRT